MGFMKKLVEDMSYELGYYGNLDAPMARYAIDKLSCYMAVMPIEEAITMAIQSGRIAQDILNQMIDERVAINAKVCNPLESMRLARMQRLMRGDL